MAYRNGNYSAFYVNEPFSESNLGAYATKDFCYYQELRMWKSAESDFPFIDSHNKNYNVRDGSDWESVLKPRLRERLRNSKNIILILSSLTKASKALNEEMKYGICEQGLPVIVVYPEFDPVTSSGKLSSKAVALWDKLPSFKNNMGDVPTLHVAMKKDQIKEALESKGLMVQTKFSPGCYVL